MWNHLRVSLGVVVAATSVACSGDAAVAPEIVPARLDRTAAASQSTFNPGSAKVYCFSETSCFAAAFEFKDYASDPSIGQPYTLFSAYFQNLQGTYPADGPDFSLKLSWFRFQFFDENIGEYIDALPTEVMSAVGNVQVGVNQSWGNDSPAAGLNTDVFFASPGSEIVGCHVLPGNPPLWFSYRTCPAEGLDGWVRVDFLLRHAGSSRPRATVRVPDFLFSFGEGGPSCTLARGQAKTCTVVPYRNALRHFSSP